MIELQLIEEIKELSFIIVKFCINKLLVLICKYITKLIS